MSSCKCNRCLLISDFNSRNFAALLKNDAGLPQIVPVETPYGQAMQILVDSNNPCWDPRPDYALIWTLPEGVLASFRQHLEGESVPLRHLLDEVDSFCRLVTAAAKRVKAVFITTWTAHPAYSGSTMLDMKSESGTGYCLMRMNTQLVDNLCGNDNIYIFNAQNWLNAAGSSAYNDKLWYMAKIPYTNTVFKACIRDIKSACTGLAGDSRKLIITDLDNTLWGGVVGDDGMEQLRLGGHDYAGEAFVDFQKTLKKMKSKGVLLAIASKNEESTALNAINNHPEMVLREDDFVGFRINWADKAQNIIELARELNLGLQSIVFIDDNPVERDRVRQSLPEVLVPEWPQDPAKYKQALLNLDCFNMPQLTTEDSGRHNMYRIEQARKKELQTSSSFDEWLMNLGTVVRIEALNSENLPRITQLLNKTNQMNLSTRRLAENELLTWSRLENHSVWGLRVTDTFGDSGLTGIVSLDCGGKECSIVDFVLSCRVMGRRIEDVMVAWAIGVARKKGCEAVRAEYIKTEKNKPCLNFWQNTPFEFNNADSTFRLSLSASSVKMPVGITVNPEG